MVRPRCARVTAGLSPLVARSIENDPGTGEIETERFSIDFVPVFVPFEPYAVQYIQLYLFKTSQMVLGARIFLPEDENLS